MATYGYGAPATRQRGLRTRDRGKNRPRAMSVEDAATALHLLRGVQELRGIIECAFCSASYRRSSAAGLLGNRSSVTKLLQRTINRRRTQTGQHKRRSETLAYNDPLLPLGLATRRRLGH